MKKIKLILDSCASLPKDLKEEYNIEVVPASFSINDEVIDPVHTTLTVDMFFDKLTNKVDMKTSGVSPNTYYECFLSYIKQGYDILYIALSSGFSCGYSNSLLAKDMLLEEYPDAKIECIDSLTGSMAIFFTAKEAQRLIDLNMDIKEIRERLDKNALNIEAMFTIGSMYHLYKGGRLKLTTAAVGSLLRIKPLVAANKEGKLISCGAHIGKKRALSAMADRLIKNIADDTVYIGYTNNLEEAIMFENKLLELNNNLKIYKYLIDFTMMCHCGPETIALFYKKKNPLD